MADRGEGKLRLTYKPLEALDELQLLLLAAIAEGKCEIGFLEKVFSLPSAVLNREMERLAAVGLVNADYRKTWACSSRGKRIVSVWHAFQGKATIGVELSSSDWKLGPGTFAVPFEVETAQDVGNLPEEDTCLDENAAMEIIASQAARVSNSTRRDSEQAQRRYRAALGVIVFSWLCKQPDPVGAVAQMEPGGFTCQVTDAQVIASSPTKKMTPGGDRASATAKPDPPEEPVPSSSGGLIDTLFRWFFG